MLIKKDTVFVIQGDSITDAGRKKDERQLGSGYARLVHDILMSKYPDYNLTIYNRGVGGDRTEHLVKRWKEDCIDLKPDIVSVLIGVNDMWHGNRICDFIPPEKVEQNLEIVFSQVKEIGAELIVMEPFLLKTGSIAENWYDMNEDLYAKVLKIRDVAKKYNARYIPLMGYFTAATMDKDPSFYSADGVHPTIDGHRFIAEKLLEVLEK